MQNENEAEILNIDDAGRAYPDVVDGTPDCFNDRDVELELEELNEVREVSDKKVSSLPSPVLGDKLDKKIIVAFNEISELKANRKQINSEIQAVIEGMESAGIPRDAFKTAVKILALSDDQRFAYDQGLRILRGAAQISEQSDMFESGE